MTDDIQARFEACRSFIEKVSKIDIYPSVDEETTYAENDLREQLISLRDEAWHLLVDITD